MLDLLQRVSHEFRTPLHAVLGFTGLVLEDDATVPLVHRRRLERAQSNARELVDSVDDILEWAAIESGERPIVKGAADLHELVASAFARMAPDAAQRGVALLAEVSRGLPSVATDPARLSRVVRHLLRVALRSTQTGRVVVRVAADPVTGAPWSLAVDDLGPAFPGPVWAATGAAPDAHAFGPGIGLLVTRALCDRLGHSLRLAPNPASAMIASIRFNRGVLRGWA
jgi:signal transduction histidine kinase